MLPLWLLAGLEARRGLCLICNAAGRKSGGFAAAGQASRPLTWCFDSNQCCVSAFQEPCGGCEIARRRGKALIAATFSTCRWLHLIPDNKTRV